MSDMCKDFSVCESGGLKELQLGCREVMDSTPLKGPIPID